MGKFISGLGPHPLSVKPLWKKIKRMKNQPSEQDIPTLIRNGVPFETDEEKARVFAERMAETFRESSDSAKTFDKQNHEKVSDFVKKKLFENNYSISCTISFLKVKLRGSKNFLKDYITFFIHKD